MTENKRFTVEDDDADIWENNHFLAVAYNHHNAKKIAKRFNQLNDENKQLKHKLSQQEMGYATTAYRQAEENEKLKSICKDHRDHANDFKADCVRLEKENEQLKASLYAEKTNTAEVVNDYSKQFKRHSAQFSFMMDLADDLGVDVATLEALDD